MFTGPGALADTAETAEATQTTAQVAVVVVVTLQLKIVASAGVLVCWGKAPMELALTQEMAATDRFSSVTRPTGPEWGPSHGMEETCGTES